MSSLSSVFIIISYNFGELISCLRVHMQSTFVECPSYNGEDLFLTRTEVLEYWDFGEPILSVKEFDF